MLLGIGFAVLVFIYGTPVRANELKPKQNKTAKSTSDAFLTEVERAKWFGDDSKCFFMAMLAAMIFGHYQSQE